MSTLPFHDGRSFIRYAEGLARDKGWKEPRLLLTSLMGKTTYYNYLENSRQPNIKMIDTVLKQLESI